MGTLLELSIDLGRQNEVKDPSLVHWHKASRVPITRVGTCHGGLIGEECDSRNRGLLAKWQCSSCIACGVEDRE